MQLLLFYIPSCLLLMREVSGQNTSPTHHWRQEEGDMISRL